MIFLQTSRPPYPSAARANLSAQPAWRAISAALTKLSCAAALSPADVCASPRASRSSHRVPASPSACISWAPKAVEKRRTDSSYASWSRARSAALVAYRTASTAVPAGAAIAKW